MPSSIDERVCGRIWVIKVWEVVLTPLEFYGRYGFATQDVVLNIF